MNWKTLITVALVCLCRGADAKPGIRTPPATFLSESNSDDLAVVPSTTIQPPTNSAGEVPLVLNRRYLQQTVEVNSPIHFDPTTESISNIGIFPGYKTSSNHIVNEFLRRNIDLLLSDKLPRNESGSQDLSRHFLDEDKSRDGSVLPQYANFKRVFIKNNNNLQNYINWQDKINFDNGNNLQVGSTPAGDVVGVGKPIPIVIITSRPSDKYETSHGNWHYRPTKPASVYSSSSHPQFSDHYVYPTVVNKVEKIPSSFPYDPADPDPFYEIVSDIPHTVVNAVLEGYGSSPDSSEKAQNLPPEKAKCPSVKVTLNQKVSLNFKPDDGTCDDVKVNVDSGNGTTSEQDEAPSRNSSDFRRPSGILSPLAASPALLHNAPSKVVPAVIEIPANLQSISSQPGFAFIPPIAGFGAGGGGAGGGHGSHGASGHGGGGHGGHNHGNKHKNKIKKKIKKKLKKKIKRKLKKFKNPLKLLGLAVGAKYLAFLASKVFMVLTVINPFNPGFWIAVLTPLAVLLVGGAGLAMVAYPFSRRHGKNTGSTVVIHRHRYVPSPGWRRPVRPRYRYRKPKQPWRPYHRRSGIPEQNDRGSRTLIPISEAYLADVDTFVKNSISKFRQFKTS